MANYYCLMAGAPDLRLEDIDSLNVSFNDFRVQVEEVLTEKDAKLMYVYFLKQDCMNLVKRLKNPQADLTQLGNLREEQIDDLINSARTMNFNVHRYPAFMSVFAREYDYNIKNEKYFPEDHILFEFYSYAMETKNEFLANWYKLNLNITNMLTAFIARKYGWTISDYIYGDNEVNELIRNNNTKDFDLKNEFEEVAQVMNIVDCNDPVQKEKLIDALKWNWLDEATFFEPFAIETVIAYLLKLEMIERWKQLDPENGMKAFKQIIETLRGEAKVPEEFVKKDLNRRQ